MLISHGMCYNRKEKSPKSYFMSAMRSSVENQINSFRLENKNCELYGSFYNLQLDHNDEKKSAFDKLVLNFINENINIKVPNKFGVMDDDIHRNCFL